MSKRGAGSIYLLGTTWWIRYSHRGQEYRESSESDSERAAQKLLKKRLQETGRRAKFLGPAEERLTFADLMQMLRDDYAVNERRSTRRLSASIKQLENVFALDRAVDVTSDRIQSYKTKRREAEAANATINRELAALKRAFKIAVDAERLSRAPHIEMLEEHNARSGFLEHADFIALRKELPEHLRDPITFLYLSGWRVSEMTKLEWADVRSASQEIFLPPAKSKNKNGRTLPLLGELADVLARAEAERKADCSYVFHRNGKQLKDFRESWATACDDAKVGKILVHDLRRTAVRDMSRAGVPDTVVMALSGHKTRAVFDRYNIVSNADLTAALERRDSYLVGRPKDRK